uniref:Uncharacterized protein n=1 Tax=Trichogramma kaykai TaxID=54128 RepID=A0ABD2XCM2_9HYME
MRHVFTGTREGVNVFARAVRVPEKTRVLETNRVFEFFPLDSEHTKFSISGKLSRNHGEIDLFARIANG